MPNKRHHRILVWVVFLLYSTVTAMQLLYPPDRTMPLARSAGTPVGYKTYDEMAQILALQFDKTKVKLVVGSDKAVERPLKLAGAEPDTAGMIAKLSNYPIWLRFVPLSVFLPADVTLLDLSFSGSVLKKFSASESQELSFKPTNARMTIENGKLVASSEIKGKVVSEKSVLTALLKAPIRLGKITEVPVSSVTANPSRTAADFSQVKTQAEAALARSVSITAGGSTFNPPPTEIASWLIISSDAQGKATLALDEQRVNKYFETINKQVGTPAGMTNVTMVDGRETARQVGMGGRMIDGPKLITQIGDFLLRGNGSKSMEAAFVDVAPIIIYNNKYTASQEGLQKYADDISVERNMHISIQQIGGTGWSVNARADESIPSASTYKLFVALMLFDKMDHGLIGWDDPMLDTTVSTCFNRMTIASTNPCAEQWLANWGRSNVNEFVYQHGFSTGTTFTAPDANHTTAADLTKYMIGLNDGTLISGAHRDRLLHSLSSHPYRYAIPTGSSAKEVYDKVGFLWDYVHDAAIVHHPRGTYVMTVMTKGQSYAAIATVTREVERIMYP